ncbi:Type 1 glutamine amidotransferase-like domain-containing protein [Kitasatospora sp. NPDC056138]|uniref:Type 1 glutamine amidotransferase-like domain-containing protein n=1 Tax=Kitasatospora sp. NPDC056138 TaxID=3345724 RepID=UPI0035D658A3
MLTGSLFLSGGGDAQDSRLLDAAFATAVDSGPLWYWPVAMDPAEVDYAVCMNWLNSVFAPLGVADIELWNGATGEALLSRFPDFRGVYIGGGNAYRLLSVIRRHDLLPALRRFVEGGGAVYGGSAGAALLGADISTIAHLDEDLSGHADTRGLSLVGGHGVFVHHRERDTPVARSWAHGNGRPVVALHERAGAVVKGGQITAVGFEPVHLIDGTRMQTLQPGETVSLLTWA